MSFYVPVRQEEEDEEVRMWRRKRTPLLARADRYRE